jgi:hypothetical protein
MNLAKILVDHLVQLTRSGHCRWICTTEDQFYCKDCASMSLALTRTRRESYYGGSHFFTAGPASQYLELCINSDKLPKTLSFSSLATPERSQRLRTLWTTISDSLNAPHESVLTALKLLDVAVPTDMRESPRNESELIAHLGCTVEQYQKVLSDCFIPQDQNLQEPSAKDVAQLKQLEATLAAPDTNSDPRIRHWNCFYGGLAVRLSFLPNGSWVAQAHVKSSNLNAKDGGTAVGDSPVEAILKVADWAWGQEQQRLKTDNTQESVHGRPR